MRIDNSTLEGQSVAENAFILAGCVLMEGGAAVVGMALGHEVDARMGEETCAQYSVVGTVCTADSTSNGETIGLYGGMLIPVTAALIRAVISMQRHKK